MPTAHRLPRAGRDPIDGAGRALAMIHELATWPYTDQTIALLLDEHRCGLAAMIVDGTHRPEHVVDVAATLAEVGRREARLAALVLASVRAIPPGPRPAERTDVDRTDVERWMELSDLLGHAGIELVEWFVVEPLGTWCPRDLLGEPTRW